MHNYLRMLWGKKISSGRPPRAALATLIELNNKYALDGRDPNSYSGIFWCFGRYDRPWAPQRPIFGTIRYMSSDNTARKVRVKQYLQTYGPGRKANSFPRLPRLFSRPVLKRRRLAGSLCCGPSAPPSPQSLGSSKIAA